MVDRWDIGEFGVPMDLTSDGDYVRYSEYAKLEQKLSAMSQQLTDTVIENQKLRDALENEDERWTLKQGQKSAAGDK